MPQFDYEFSNQDKDLVVSREDGSFGAPGDYIRLTVYPSESNNNIVTLDNGEKAIFYSSEIPLSINVSPFYDQIQDILELPYGTESTNDFVIYRKPTNDIYIKPNEIFNKFELPQGEYKIQIDFLNQVKPPLEVNPIADTDGDMGDDSGDVQEQEQFSHYPFVIKEISTSRKEIRLKLLNQDIENNSEIITNLTNEFNNNIDGSNPEFIVDTDSESPTFGQQINNPNFKYQFQHLLNIGTGDHIPIMNYTFDKLTNGKNNQSIILKLYNALPTTISTISLVTIEKEVLITQTENLFYFSDVPDVFFGDGLEPDPQENWINFDTSNTGFENFDKLSGSLNQITLDNLVSQSQYNYPNLNTDFNEFENHTFFGSAKKKLENFRTKVETIQGYYSEISKSLHISCSIDTDSNYIIQNRKSLFKKVNDEFKKFTPYERFLYFDGQSDTTASAPGLGKNYADTIPIQQGININTGEPFSHKDYQGQINGGDGFDVVYHHSSKDAGGATNSQYIDLFTNKYYAQNPPFFNYSSSIYLSFLIKADSGSALSWENRNSSFPSDGGDVKFPRDTMYRNSILTPQLTGSEYQRYVYQVSQSYFVPTSVVNYDLSQITKFENSSNQIEVIHGSMKTGSNKIMDSSNKYQNYTTVVTGSGVKFKGSVMPAGELFRIFYQNSLSSSLQGYWNIDDVTSGSALPLANVTNDAGPTTGDADNITSVTASAGLEVHGRQYGTSYYSISASNGAPGVEEGIVFDSTDFNYSKDDNFSMAIWVKRFHPDNALGDSGNPAHDRYEVFMRGNIDQSYGIDYVSGSDVFRVGVRSGSTSFRAEKAVTDAGLGWHHVAFTYESGSSTGVKIYVDGELGAEATNIGVGEFSASSFNNQRKLSIGHRGTLSGNKAQFNGFLQYPRVYNRTITPTEVQQLYLNPTGITETKITDVKITLNNPTNVLPFDNIYHTGSTNWTNWYNDMLTKAETFDTDNIHSFENNLPTYIQESSEYNDMKDFLKLQGEQYDLIRNHIDSMGTLHNRGYKKTNSPPDNALPVLLSNMGWDAKNPYVGTALSESLGKYLTNVTSVDDIKNATWRKTLNNLTYIYKSKGTKNSVRALLNTYGYPPDVLSFQEFGGTTNQIIEGSPGFISDSPPSPTGVDTNFSLITGSTHFTSKRQKNYRYIFNGVNDRLLNLDWWMDDANLNTIEFVYKHSQTKQTQTILKSSGSGAETLWDLRLVPSSDGVSSSLEFRLNKSLTGSLAIADNAYSMSTNYTNISDGQLWNVMLQRMTGSNSTNITNEYRLHLALQDNTSITTYNYVTMSLSGSGVTGDNKAIAHKNFMNSGSRHPLSSSNLFVGELLSGSISQIKGWSTALSTSRFRQHTLNKFSAVGNDIDSHRKELRYHFKLNENYSTSSLSSSAQSLTIVDSAPKTTLTTNYSFEKVGTLFTSSVVYGFDFIDVVNFSTQDNTTNKQNDNKIIINPERSIVDNLSSHRSAVKSLSNQLGEKPQLITSDRLELYRSPQTFVNDFILNNISSFNLETLYGNPIYNLSQSYDEFDTFRNDFFDAHEIKIDTNKFVRAHEDVINYSVVEDIKKLVPARSTFSGRKANIGVEIKPTILEKQKYENHKASVEANPNTTTGSHNVNIKLNDTVFGKEVLSIYDSVKEGTVQATPTTSGSKLELPITASISLGNSYVTSSGYLAPHSGSNVSFKNHNHPPFLQPDGYVVTIENPILSNTISPLPTYDSSTVVLSNDGTIDYASQANKSFVNIHSSWGTSHSTGSDTHFINYAAGTGSRGDYNVRHIDTRNVFHMIGDMEHYSGSRGSSSRFDDHTRFQHRLLIDNDFHSNITYESLINGAVGKQTGRAMGKTRYFRTVRNISNGTVTDTYPSNHVSRFSQPFKDRMNEGTQNTNPGILPVQGEDYSTASFYRVRVTGGESQIRVQKGESKKDNNDRIIY